MVPCYYLHSTAARSKITDWPSATCPFCPRSSHMSFLPLFTQWAVAISPTPCNQRVMSCGSWLDLSDLPIWDWPVQNVWEPISLTHHHQNAYACTCTLGIFLGHSTSLLMSHSPMLATCNIMYLLFALVLNPPDLATFSLRYINYFETDCFF